MIEPTELGLFPLSVVLLPGEVAPLHIFEERYKLLFNELMDGGEFGTILVEEEGLRERGCSARLAEVIERMDDGRLNVLVQGARRFRLLEIREPEDLGSTYLTGVVEFFDDDEPEAPQELVAKALEAFRRMLVLMDVPSPREPAGEGPSHFVSPLQSISGRRSSRSSSRPSASSSGSRRCSPSWRRCCRGWSSVASAKARSAATARDTSRRSATERPRARRAPPRTD